MTHPDPTPTHTHGTGSDGLSVLTKKVGPLPGWVWVALAVGGYVLYRHFHAGNPTANSLMGTPATPATPATTPTDPYAGLTTGINETTLPGPGNGVTTNSEWARQAELLLQPQHKWSAGVISTSLYRYVNNKPLTAQETAVVNAAIALEGPPPQGVLPIVTAPTPKPPTHTPDRDPKPKPKRDRDPRRKHPHTYVVKSPGMRMVDVAHMFYGDTDTETLARLHNANRDVHEPFKVGQRLTLPN